MLLAQRELEAHAALGDAVPLDEGRHRFVDAELGAAQVHRVDRVRRDGNLDRRARHFFLTVVADDRRLPPPRHALERAIEIHEVHRARLGRIVDDAGAQTARDEGEMGIRVGRLDLLLLRREFVPVLELVVAIAGAFRKHLAEEIDVGTDAAEAAVQTRAEPRRQETRRRVLRRIHVTLKGRETLAVLIRGESPDIEHVVAITRSQCERELDRRQRCIQCISLCHTNENRRASGDRSRAGSLPAAVTRRGVTPTERSPPASPSGRQPLQTTPADLPSGS